MKEKILKGTIFLTVAGILTRIIGFLYRIFLANTLGETELGIYQLVFPVYSICFTLYAAGLQTAVSQLISNPNYKYSKKVIKTGILLSLCVSVSLSGLVFVFSDYISIRFLFAPKTAPLLRILALIFPFCGITSMINGYFYGLREAKVPAITQMVEQLFRVGFVFLIYTSHICEFSSKVAVAGLIAGELCSNLYNLISLKRACQKETGVLKLSTTKIASAIVKQAVPLSGTKLVISLLASLESVLIPIMFMKYGLSHDNSLALYGVITGIVLPFILFPGTITNSLSVLLLPEISKADNENNRDKIQHTTRITIKYSLLLGCMATAVFLNYGTSIGTLFFHSENAGRLLTLLAVICPFIYVSTTLASIINGLSRTHITFRNTVSGLLVRILFLIFVTPKYGVYGYLLGLLLSQMIISILDSVYLIRNKYTQIDLGKWLILPAALFTSSIYLFRLMAQKICLSLHIEKDIFLLISIVPAFLVSFYIFHALGLVSRRDFS